MNIVKTTALALAATVSFVASIDIAQAASPATEAFLANVTPNVDFLDRSSRMALENSGSLRLKDFARGQATSQTMAANALFDATTKLADAPVQTGRSVSTASVAPVDARLPLGQEDLDSIEGLKGVEFDEAFRAKQRSALMQVQTDYETYLATGDDVALKAIAEKALPDVKRKIAALSKI